MEFAQAKSGPLFYKMMSVYRFDWRGHHINVANYRAKGAEFMRNLARTGGLKSGETRRRLRELKELTKSEERIPAAMLKAKRPSPSGGSHVNDWRCPIAATSTALSDECARSAATVQRTADK